MIVRIDVPSLDVDGACDRNVCAVVVSSLDVVHRRSRFLTKLSIICCQTFGQALSIDDVTAGVTVMAQGS
jgi:hypothetical protein